MPPRLSIPKDRLPFRLEEETYGKRDEVAVCRNLAAEKLLGKWLRAEYAGYDIRGVMMEAAAETRRDGAEELADAALRAIRKDTGIDPERSLAESPREEMYLVLGLPALS